MCGAKKGGLDLKGVDIDKEAVIQGQVLRGEEPVGGAYVRLLDSTGEFTAEVPTSATGHFRFFAAPGSWTLRTLAPAHLPQEQAQRAGPIPTAATIPWSKAANDDGTFRSDDELKTLYADAGVDFGKDTIAYCRIGERSAHTWFVLHEILGQQNVKNYDGSWTEWGSLVGVPVALGDEPGKA
jgi:rhodanese-related sulfurtransferase